jgi:hypothetical protein
MHVFRLATPAVLATYQAFLASLVTGSGTSLVAPTAASINSSSTGICATVPSAVKTVM